jgi:hypothetical protein
MPLPATLMVLETPVALLSGMAVLTVAVAVGKMTSAPTLTQVLARLTAALPSATPNP